MGENRALGKELHRNQPMYPEGHIGPVPCAEEDFARGTRKGPNLAPASATVKGSAETQMGKPSHGRRNARRATTPTTLGPEGAVRQTSKLATDARHEKAFEGGARLPTGPA